MKNKRAIIFVSIATDLYGSSRVMLSLVLHLKKDENYYPVVCLPPGSGPLRDILVKEEISIIDMQVVKLKRELLRKLNFLGLFNEYHRSRKIFREATRDMDIAAIQSNTLATLFGALYCKRKKIPHIWHIHEIVDRPKAARHFFYRCLRWGADHIVFNSEETERFYLEHYPVLKKNAVTIINGVDRDLTMPNSEERQQLRKVLFKSKPSERLIGLVGRINRLKGHGVLLDAFEIVHKVFPQTALCFIGSPPPGQEFYLEELKKKIEARRLSQNVRLIGFQEAIYPVMDALDIVVVPSTEPESFGLVVVEAMLSKKPIIASEIGGIPTILDHGRNGLIVPPGNPEALADAILNVLKNPTFEQELASEALTKVREKFSTARMYREFVAFYKQHL